MPTPSQRLQVDSSITFDGIEYELREHSWEPAPTQPGDAVSSFEVRIENWALGWGASKYTQVGQYDYAAAACMHRSGCFLPGAAVTTPSFGVTTPSGLVSFCEYWDGTAANRRLLAIAGRTVHEIQPNGTITGNSLTTPVDSGDRMMKGFRFKAATAMSAPYVFIPVQGSESDDYFIVRTAANTYAKTSANKRAQAMAAGKDVDGEDIVWRIDESGRLNATTTDSDPNSSGSWAGATYATGEGSVKANDLIQVGRQLLVGREDGAWSWDTARNSIPITKGLEATPGAENFTYFKEAFGYILAPTSQGLVWIEGMEWGMCGPVSSNEAARNLRGSENAVSGAAGAYVYAAVYSGTTSYIFLGTIRRQGESGEGPFTWHGPVATIGQKVEDLHVSTVFGNKLWMGYSNGFSYINLNDDFSPATDLAAGYIYLPEGIFDTEGAAIIKDFEKAEFVTRAATPFSSSNKWGIEIEGTPGSGTFTAIDGGEVSSGATAERFWSTATSGTRLRGRLTYSANGGAAELESVTVRGKLRPETTRLHTFTIEAKDAQRTPRGVKVQTSAKAQRNALEAMVGGGRKTVKLYGQDTLTGQVVSVQEATERTGSTQNVGRGLQVQFREAAIS